MRNAHSSLHAERVFRVAGVGTPEKAREVPSSPVNVSWNRCLHDFKLDPARDYQTCVIDSNQLKDLQAEHEELVQIARAEMDLLYEQIAASGYALLLADAAGVILCERVDPTLRSEFTRAGLVLGAEWSEEREGTNGIGTCVRAERPITIHEQEHFRSRHANLSCSAAPIHDHLGRIIAVLDASCVAPKSPRELQLHTVAMVNQSARLIEKCLFLRRHRGESLLRFHHRPEFIDLPHDGVMAVSSEGIILAADLTCLRLLEARRPMDLMGRSIAEIFDTTYDGLASPRGSKRRAIWQLRDHQFGRSYYASLFDPADETHSIRTPLASTSRTIVHVACDKPVLSMSLEDLAGEDPQMLRNVRNAKRIADRPVSVFIHGPTGSGKEAFAKALHLASKRANKAFIAVNCAAIPEALIESELFGYVPGAFTGARRTGLRGRIAQSSGGTLFLDEIGDMPFALQARLLRVLEENEVTPLGSDDVVKVDLRVICASHRNLRELMQRKEFREDLYYRLNGITIELPALSARRDREALIRGCIARETAGGAPASIESAALAQLIKYPWPGNVRELRNVVRTAVAIREGEVIRLADLPLEIRQFKVIAGDKDGSEAAMAATAAGDSVTLQAAERRALLHIIERNGWVMKRVAQELGVSRNTLYRKIKLHRIPLTRVDSPARPD